MPEHESPELRSDRTSSIVAAVLVCLATPTVVLLAYDLPGDAAVRRGPLIWLAVSAFVGAAVPYLYWSPYRALGLAAYASLGWLAATAQAFSGTSGRDGRTDCRLG
jgi:hypothetical protein